MAEIDHLWLAFGRKGGGGGEGHVETAEINHLRLAFGHEGGGGGGTGGRIDEKPPPARIWTRGRWWWWVTC